MKKQTAGYGYTQKQPKKILAGLDITTLTTPLSPADIADITHRRTDAQDKLRKRIDEGVVSDG
jgi:hypothetical protein